MAVSHSSPHMGLALIWYLLFSQPNKGEILQAQKRGTHNWQLGPAFMHTLLQDQEQGRGHLWELMLSSRADWV